MGRHAAVLIGFVVVGSARAADPPKTFTFAAGDAGKLPAGWSAARTGTGEGSVWKVLADASTPSKTGYALAQTAEGPTQLYNLCVVDNSAFQDGEIRVQFKAVKGEIDQGGGIVWRYADADNYYICRYNPLEENFRVYTVKGGRRTQLATKENLELAAGKWYALAIKQAGNRIECWVDGKKYLEVTDDTFKGKGKVGLWTKADAVTHFDDFRVAPTDPK